MALTRSSVTSLGLAEAEVSNLSASLDLAIGTLMPNPAIATAMAASREEGLQPVTQGNIVGVGVGTKDEIPRLDPVEKSLRTLTIEPEGEPARPARAPEPPEPAEQRRLPLT